MDSMEHVFIKVLKMVEKENWTVRKELKHNKILNGVSVIEQIWLKIK